MDKNKLMPIERLLNLKTGETEFILAVSLKVNKEIIFESHINEDMKMLIAPFFNDLTGFIMKSISFADGKRLESKKSELSSEIGSPLLILKFKFVEDGNLSIESYFDLVSPEVTKTEKGKEMFKKYSALLDKVVAHSTALIDTYSVMKEEGELYSKRGFEFKYRKVNGSWKYDDFVSSTDRPITEQKSEVQNLIEKETDTLLLDIVNAQGINDTEQLHISFHSDGLNVIDVQYAVE